DNDRREDEGGVGISGVAGPESAVEEGKRDGGEEVGAADQGGNRNIDKVDGLLWLDPARNLWGPGEQGRERHQDGAKDQQRKVPGRLVNPARLPPDGGRGYPECGHSRNHTPAGQQYQ